MYKYLISFLLFFLILYVTMAQNVNFKLVKGSSLTISGTTNIKKPFECACNENFYLAKYQLHSRDMMDTVYVDFTNATVIIPTKSFICENESMTEDMHEALKANEFPTVSLTVIKASIPKDNISAATITADLTITGVTKRITLPLEVEQYAKNMYRFVGVKDLLMTDFKITPPTALLGMIRVKDNIKINIDFKAEISSWLCVIIYIQFKIYYYIISIYFYKSTLTFTIAFFRKLVGGWAKCASSGNKIAKFPTLSKISKSGLSLMKI